MAMHWLLICQAFLLFGPLSQSSWPARLAESRGTYKSLRDHFLRFIDHPNDLHSAADPLADDDAVGQSTCSCLLTDSSSHHGHHTVLM